MPQLLEFLFVTGHISLTMRIVLIKNASATNNDSRSRLYREMMGLGAVLVLRFN